MYRPGLFDNNTSRTQRVCLTRVNTRMDEDKSNDVEELSNEDKDEPQLSPCEEIFAECAMAWLEANAIRVLNAQMDAAKNTKKPPLRRSNPQYEKVKAPPVTWSKERCKNCNTYSCIC